jgi:hypothetical protein
VITIGIDVGVTGAIAALDTDGTYRDVRDLPIFTHGETHWVDATELLSIILELRDGQPARAAIEQIHGTPKMGVVTCTSMGLTLGSVLATVQMAGIGFELVKPAQWKKHYGLIMPKASDREKKHASLCRARQLFPTAPLERVKYNGRAEALLIANYAASQRYSISKEAA